MTEKEFEIYEKEIKNKYKHYKTWKILAIVFMILTVALCVLYFGSGDIFKETVNNTEVEIINDGGSNNNNVNFL